MSTAIASTYAKPVYILPFVRNSGFIGREQLLDQIDQRFSSGQSRVELCGLGGIGKSQIALEYAFRVKEKSSETSVF